MNRLAAFGDVVRALKGWRRALFAFVSGLVSVLSFAPFGFFPAMLFGFAALVLLIDGAQSARRPVWSAALAGWTFGLGFFVGGLYWISYAFLVDAVAHAWQIPFAIGILSAFLALYAGAASAAMSALWRPGPSRILLLAAFYAIGEWLRGHLLTGFPWNLPAYGWGASLGVMQSNALFGAYGMTLLTVLLGASFAPLFQRGVPDWKFTAGVTALFVAMWIGGDVRLAMSPTAYVPGVRLRVVQPDIPQAEKFPLEYRDRNWHTLMQMSVDGKGPPPTHIIWPESAPPFFLARQPAALDDIALLTARGSVLVTGAVRGEMEADEVRYFNSLYVFAHGSEPVATYDKFHLVPFGEYLPLEPLFRALGIDKLVDSPGNFTPGGGPRTFDIPGAPPASPLICYEVLFPGAIIGSRRGGWIVNVTDDSWFGPPSSTGPRQHFLTVRVRAIEEGLPVVRSANTGISAVIDANGRVLQSLAPGEKGVIDASLPQELQPPLYARLGDTVFVLMLVCCFALAFAFRRRSAQG